MFPWLFVACIAAKPVVSAAPSISLQAKEIALQYGLTLPTAGGSSHSCPNPLSNAWVKATWLNPVPGMVLMMELSGPGVNGWVEDGTYALPEIDREWLTNDRPEAVICWSEAAVQLLEDPIDPVTGHRYQPKLVYREITLPQIPSQQFKIALENDVQFREAGDGRYIELPPPYDKAMTEVVVEFAAPPGEYHFALGPCLHGYGVDTAVSGVCRVSEEHTLSCDFESRITEN